jgi:hypothetical protein
MMAMSRGRMQVSQSPCVEDYCYHRNDESDENENDANEQCGFEASTPRNYYHHDGGAMRTMVVSRGYMPVSTSPCSEDDLDDCDDVRDENDEDEHKMHASELISLQRDLNHFDHGSHENNVDGQRTHSGKLKTLRRDHRDDGSDEDGRRKIPV